MKYDIDWLNELIQSGKTPGYEFFWGHQSRTFGKIDKACLSQWYSSPFIHKGISYPTTEHWMMAGKARLFQDAIALEKILHCKSPKEAKAIGRAVLDFSEEIWNRNRERIVKNGNYLKFSQHQELKQFLLSTENRIIVEASPYDRIWGIGMKSDHPDAKNPINWKGINLLGFALMEVRDKLNER